MSFPSPQRLVGVVSGMIVWAVWFVVVYALTGVGCGAGWNERAVPGGDLLRLSMLLSTAVALALIGGCACRGYVGWRSGEEGRGSGREVHQRARFMGLVMFVLSLLAAVGTVMVAIPIVMLDPCAA